MSDERPASPTSKAVRLTRKQLATQQQDVEHLARTVEPAAQPKAATEQVPEDSIPGAQEDDVAEVPMIETERTVDAAMTQDDQDTVAEPMHAKPEPEIAQEAEVDAPLVEITSEPEPKTLSSEKPLDETTKTPVMSRTPSRRASRSPSKSPMRIEESIEAIDALEEALEDVGKAVSHFDQSNDEKSPRKKAALNDAATPITRGKTTRKTPLASRVSRTPSAVPQSMKASSGVAPATSSGAPKPTKSSLARASSVRTAPSRDLKQRSTDTVDYLASKRRPVSVSFPTPPPPPKGRAPTKPTFHLSSDAVAAKLKAQKEERLKREAEREAEGAPKQRPVSVSLAPHAKSTKAPTRPDFQLPGEAIAVKLKAQKDERLQREAEGSQGDQPRARPVSIYMPPPTAKSTKPPTKPNFQLPGEAIAAKLRMQKEERLQREAEGTHGDQQKTRPVSICMPPPTAKSTKPPTKANFQLPGEAVAARLKAQREERQKREEEAEAEKKAAPSKPRPSIARKPVTLPSRNAPGVSIPPPPKSEQQAPLRSSTLASKRTSIQVSRSISNSSSNRTSVLISKPAAESDDAAQPQPKLTGREVFLRDKVQNNSKERERKEKEEAAKKARADAAERGRAASRDWAEKQRQKMVGPVKAKVEGAA